MDPLHGVLHEARLAAFCRRFRLRRDELTADFSGWHKRVLLSPDDAFLFPRHDEDIPLVERQAVAHEALAGVGVVPASRGLWRDGDISPYPFLQTERRFGTGYAELEDDLAFEEVALVLERLGASTAAWHSVPTAELPDVLREPPEGRDFVASFLDPRTLRERLGTIQETLSSVLPSDVSPAPSWVEVWEGTLGPLALVPPVLTHGDVHETQLIVDDDLEIVAVLDWDHACLAHPGRDFNFGEWGYGIFSWEHRFDELYRRYWDAYRSRREASLPDHRSILLLRVLTDAMRASASLASDRSWWSAHRLRNCAEHIAVLTREAG